MACCRTASFWQAMEIFTARLKAGESLVPAPYSRSARAESSNCCTASVRNQTAATGHLRYSLPSRASTATSTAQRAPEARKTAASCINLPLREPTKCLYNFCSTASACTTGAYPNAIVQDAGGSFFGTTLQGGNTGDGTVFELTSTNQYKVLHSFRGFDGEDPQPGIDSRQQWHLVWGGE